MEDNIYLCLNCGKTNLEEVREYFEKHKQPKEYTRSWRFICGGCKASFELIYKIDEKMSKGCYIFASLYPRIERFLQENISHYPESEKLCKCKDYKKRIHGGKQ